MTRSLQHTTQRGLSLVETMVGLAVGLFIVGGAIKLFIDNLDSNRRLLIETRVNQDLRAAADLIARDLRRASYWQQAASGVWTPAAPALDNPYAAVTASAGRIVYSYDIAASAAGFWLDGGKIRSFATGAWQDLTDPSTMTVTAFDISEVTREVCLLSRCPCPAGTAACPPDPVCSLPAHPRITVRQYSIALQARANSDANVVRRIEETVRVRNDQLSGQCPAT